MVKDDWLEALNAANHDRVCGWAKKYERHIGVA